MEIADLIASAMALDMDITALSAVIIASSFTLLSVKHYQESWSKRRESGQESLKSQHEEIENNWIEHYSRLESRVGETDNVREKMQKTKMQNENFSDNFRLSLARMAFYRSAVDDWDGKATNFLGAFLLLAVVFALVGYVPHPEIIQLNVTIMFLAAVVVVSGGWWLAFRFIGTVGLHAFFSLFPKGEKIQKIDISMAAIMLWALLFFLGPFLVFASMLIVQLPTLDLSQKGISIPDNSILINIVFSVIVIIMSALKIVFFGMINSVLARGYKVYRKDLSLFKEASEATIETLTADVDKATNRQFSIKG